MKWKKTSNIIGRGSTATVYLAGDSFSGELVAAKSTKLSLSSQLQRENSILSKLDSPYIVKYKGFEITEQQYTLFTEYHPLGTLRDEIGKLQYDESTVRSYTWQILRGVEYLHSIGIVHCDIKPSNLLIDGQKQIKIADFGCSKFLSDNEPLTFSGSPAFMAPEVVNGQRQGFESDLWSLGCTVVEMATGKIPWLGDDPISAFYRIGISGDWPEIPDSLSPNLKEFLSFCFKREPKERLSAKELLEHSFFHGFSEMTSSPEFEKPSSPSPRSVFDQSVWDYSSYDQSQSQSSFVDYYIYSDRVAERIRRLTTVGSSTTSDDRHNDVSFDDDDEDWVTVRSNVISSGNIRERRVAVYFDECVEETDIVINKSLKKENFRYLQYLPYLFPLICY